MKRSTVTFYSFIILSLIALLIQSSAISSHNWTLGKLYMNENDTQILGGV